MNTILHLGLGAFHRAHQADYTQDAGGWTIETVAMRNPALAQALNAREGRFTLIEQHADGPRAKRITCMGRAWSLPDEAPAIAARMAAPDVHILTLTVTEKGYAPDQPLWPLLAAGLAARRAARRAAPRAAERPGLTLMCCDNLPDNGATLRHALLAQLPEDLAQWTAANCTFPATMVDRITPRANDATFATAKHLTGQDDPCAVETEPFRQWVIEDSFAGPHPDWTSAGAALVADVKPYEDMKLRMLNGAHSLLAYTGALHDLSAVRDVMARPDLAALIRAHMEEAARSLPPIPGFEAQDYATALMTRFANPAIDHRCLQIAMDGSQKLPQRILAPAADLLQQGDPATSCARAIATWMRFLHGHSLNGAALPLDDPQAETLRALPKGDAAAALRALGPAGTALAQNAGFTTAITQAYDTLR
ncbi:mannitol dehydrogenase family protein [Roseobacteraceae bacterium S113]